MHPIGRRATLASLGAIFGWSFAPRLSSAAGSADPRLLVLVLRGGLDGLAAVPALGDPGFANARVAPELLEAGATTPLDNMFALNRNMPRLAAMYGKREALIVHATASPYRQRSHFDAQDVLETGFPDLTGSERTGWLNRAMTLVPRGQRLAPPHGLAIAATIPMILRGPAPVETWQRQVFRYADDDTIARLLDIYEARDPVLAEALRQGASVDTAVRQEAGGEDAAPPARTPPSLAEDARAAARFIAQPDGPRIASISFGGWDTHTNQGSVTGQLGRNLAALDQALGALQDGLQPIWRDTVVVVVTEFGRTVRINGSRGTDHGVGTIALLLGGAVKGGRVLADWPGLAPDRLYEGRDLNPTTDIRSVLKGVLAEHLGLADGPLGEVVFPASQNLRPLRGLLA